MDVADLIAGLSIRADPGCGQVRVCDVTDDSRTAVPGSLFIARRGEKADGRRFVAQAVDAGAVAVLTDDQDLAVPPGVARLVSQDAAGLAHATALLAERFYGHPSRKLALVGITGTNGKTTTAHLVHQVLNGAGVRCGLIGTVIVDDGTETARAELTTPGATELSWTLSRMADAGCRAAAMEVSSHALHQSRVAGLEFRVGVFTNLTGDHLDYHGTIDAYAEAKATLFEALPPNALAIINADDPAAERMVRDCPARVLRCSLRRAPASEAGWRASAEVRSLSMAGTEVALHGPWGSIDTPTRLLGRHNVMNLLQAAAACHALGLAADQIRAGIGRAAPPPGRLEPVTRPGDPFAVLVDYAHTDDALHKVLATLRPLRPPGGALRVVFGCGGDRDRTKRPRMGAVAAGLADAVYVTSDNPRTERPDAIIAEIVAGIPAERLPRATVEPDRRAAIEAAIADAAPGDVVLIAGKGHEDYQIVPDGRGGTRTLAFDDREVARRALGTPGVTVRSAAGGVIA